ncbi:MAG TPA: hypothetical protein VGD24_00415 [Gallionella sp.]
MLLAAKIARERRLTLLPDAYLRVRDTPPQSVLPWKERKKNVRNAFRCEMDLTGKRVALVDDADDRGQPECARRSGAKTRRGTDQHVGGGAEVAAPLKHLQ